MSVILETTVGDITIDLYLEERPRTCLNFLKLCKVKYYNYCLIHYVERNFMVQMGDPTSTGRGGESIFGMLYGDQAKYFEPELVPKLKHQKVGTLSMVNNGSNMHGSQFFITTSEDLDYLDGVHTVFGEVVEGMEVLMKINDSICDEQNRPYKDIRLSHTVILDDPFDDPPGLEVPPMSPEPTEEQLKSDRIGAHEDIDETEGKSMEEIQEEIKDKEAKARATILEMVGDLPDADVKPPENVLFICKLNPVTTDEDLEIIFSRFGKISSCEIIRDKKTGDSLQYAFIEFENEADCENAYFKMDNVLIDDRRIHVDFSQSVAKLTWMGKGRGVVDNRNKQEKEASKFTFKSTARSQGNYEMVFDDELPEENLIKDIKKLKKKSKDKNYDEKSSGKDKSSARYDEKSSGRYDEKSSGRYDEKSSARYDEKYSGRSDEKSSARYDEKYSGRYDEKSNARYEEKSSGRYDDKSGGRYYDYDRQKKFVNDRDKSHRKELDRSRDRDLYSERSDRYRDSDRHSRFERDSSDSYKKHSSSDRYRDRYSRYEKNSDDYKKHFSSERDRDIDRYRYDKDSSYSYKKYSSDNRKSYTRERSKEKRRHESSDDSYDSDYKSRSKRYSETSRKEDSRRRKSRT